jgi:hypothetical protein
MACEISRMSCSLCPYCATESCPHYHDHDNDPRYWIYITDRRNSYLIPIFKSNDLKEVKEFLLSNKIKNKTNWAKKYIYSVILGEKVKNRYPNAKDISFPYVEFTITDGEINWNTSVNLTLSLEEHKFYYYDKYESDIKYGQKIALEKPWDKKLKFKR